MPVPRRPAIVSIVAAFLAAAAMIALVTGITLLIPRTPLDQIWQLNPAAHQAFAAAGRASGSGLLALACAVALAAKGLLNGRRWAWQLTILLFALNGMGDLVSLFLTRDRIRGASGILVAGGFLFLLLRPSVRTLFAGPA